MQHLKFDLYSEREVMKMQLKNMIILALSIAFFSVSSSYAQTQKDVQYIKGYLEGHEFQVTYREGGSLYGTYSTDNVLQ